MCLSSGVYGSGCSGWWRGEDGVATATGGQTGSTGFTGTSHDLSSDAVHDANITQGLDLLTLRSFCTWWTSSISVVLVRLWETRVSLFRLREQLKCFWTRSSTRDSWRTTSAHRVALPSTRCTSWRAEASGVSSSTPWRRPASGPGDAQLLNTVFLMGRDEWFVLVRERLISWHCWDY